MELGRRFWELDPTHAAKEVFGHGTDKEVIDIVD